MKSIHNIHSVEVANESLVHHVGIKLQQSAAHKSIKVCSEPNNGRFSIGE